MCLLFLWHHDQLLILIRIFVREKGMNMKRIYWLFLATLVILAQYSCGSEDKTYGEQKEQEREVVSSFQNSKTQSTEKQGKNCRLL